MGPDDLVEVCAVVVHIPPGSRHIGDRHVALGGSSVLNGSNGSTTVDPMAGPITASIASEPLVTTWF